MTRFYIVKRFVGPSGEFDAVQYDGRNGFDLLAFARAEEMEEGFLGDCITLKIAGRDLTLSEGDWLLREDGGEVYSESAAAFAEGEYVAAPMRRPSTSSGTPT